MRASDIKNVYDLMDYCKKPLYFQRPIRDMNVGDIFLLGICNNIAGDDKRVFIAEAWIEKHRGIHRFFGTWTIPIKQNRSKFVMTSGELKILKDGTIQLDKTDAIYSFALVCRYMNWLAKKLTTNAIEQYHSRSLMPFFSGLWLNSKYISKKPFINTEEFKWEYLDFREYAPTQQLKAIVRAGRELNLI